MSNEMFSEWIANVMTLPEDLRHEAINRRGAELTAKQRESVNYLLQINRKQTRHMNPRRVRPIGPVDRAMRRLEEQYRNSR